MKVESYKETKNFLIIVLSQKIWTLPRSSKFFETAKLFLENGDNAEVLALYDLFKQDNNVSKSKVKSKQPVFVPTVESTFENTMNDTGVKGSSNVCKSKKELPSVYAIMEDAIRKGLPYTYLENFIKKGKSSVFLAQNDNLNDFFYFLKTNNIPICDDGCIVLTKFANYKKRDFNTNLVSFSSGCTISTSENKAKEKLNKYLHYVENVGTLNDDFFTGHAELVVAAPYSVVMGSEFAAKHHGYVHIMEIKVNPRHVFKWGFVHESTVAFKQFKVLRFIKNKKTQLINKVFTAKKSQLKQSNKGRRRSDELMVAKFTNVPLKIGADNRVCVVKRLLQAIDATYKSKVKCEYTKDKIVISLANKDDVTQKNKFYIYSVDNDNTFKISKKIIEASGLVKKKIFADVIDNVILIKAK